METIQVLPGFNTQHILGSAAWAGQSLEMPALHKKFDVNVIGLLDKSEGDEQPEVLFSSELTKLLAQGDELVVYGRNENLDALEAAVSA